jgi:hypothetical protein
MGAGGGRAGGIGGEFALAEVPTRNGTTHGATKRLTTDAAQHGVCDGRSKWG